MRWLLSDYKHVVVLLKNYFKNPQFDFSKLHKKSQESNEVVPNRWQLLS